MRGILPRCQALRIRKIQADFFVHPQHDPGCLLNSHDFLRSFPHNYRHALVLMDRDGCGQEEQEPGALEARIEKELSAAGWGDRTKAIVLVPELEIWVWSASPHVDEVLGWGGRSPGLREWLHENGYAEADSPKPLRPKEAVEQALKIVGTPWSSALFQQLAEKVSLSGCSDTSFQRLVTTLRSWFPQESAR